MGLVFTNEGGWRYARNNRLLEARPKAKRDERRKVLEEVVAELKRLAETRADRLDTLEFAPRALLTAAQWAESQLAALDAPGDGEGM